MSGLPTLLQREPFASRRQRLIEARPDALLVVPGAGPDGPSSSFWYLTGIAEPTATLLLSARPFRFGMGYRYPGPEYVDGTACHQLLFVPAPDALSERWGMAGPASTSSVSADAVGVDVVASTGVLGATLDRGLSEVARVEIVRGFAPSLDGPDDPDTVWLRRLRDRFTHLTVGDATAVVHDLRRVKSGEEIAAIERAVGVVHQALERAIAAMHPGQPEAAIEAELTATYRAAGATHAFAPIVAAGRNALKLHYERNDGALAADELLLIDTGAQLDGYCADISRTLPIAGKFSAVQRARYDAVHGALEATLDACRPGATLGGLHRIAWQRLDAAGHGEHFPHGTSHHLGVDVHDVGNLWSELTEGAVFTVEPGLYDETDGIGIRLEEDVALTADGHRVLSSSIPVAAGDVEGWVARWRGGAA